MTNSHARRKVESQTREGGSLRDVSLPLGRWKAMIFPCDDKLVHHLQRRYRTLFWSCSVSVRKETYIHADLSVNLPSLMTELRQPSSIGAFRILGGEVLLFRRRGVYHDILVWIVLPEGGDSRRRSRDEPEQRIRGCSIAIRSVRFVMEQDWGVCSQDWQGIPATAQISNYEREINRIHPPCI